MPNYTYTRDRPAGDLTPASQRSDMQTNTNSADTIWTDDHYGFNDNNGGLHKKVTLIEQTVAPSAVADAAVIYSLDDGSGNTETYLKRNVPSLTFLLTFVKAYGSFAGSTGTTTTSYNCSVVRDAVGNYSVTFTVPLANTNYGVVTSGQMNVAFTTGGVVGVSNRLTTGFKINVKSLTAVAGADINPVCFIVFGI